MLLLPLLFACVEGPQTTGFMSVTLPGTPTGVVLGADARVIVSHDAPDGCCVASGYVPGGSIPAFQHAVSEVPPVVAEGRVYLVQPDGLVALEADRESWSVAVEADMEAAIAVTPAGIVMVPSWDGVQGRLHAWTRLGEEAWVTDLQSQRVVGAIRARADGTVYVATTDGVMPLLHGVDGSSGAILWSESVDAKPLAVVDDAVLVDVGGVLARFDADGREVWVSGADVGEAGVTATSDGFVWVPGATHVAKVALDNGGAAQRIERRCGALAYGLDQRMWGVCEVGEVGWALAAIGAVIEVESTTFGGPSVGPPVLAGGNAYVVIDNASTPSLLGFAGATLPNNTSPWSTAYGVGNAGRPDQ
ncbi:MAG: PQQ-like beta-propeller repeat protein [Alphaproteobacteria bacterium]|nr:PQQ-like beta-propeller repeat protein [Alphaproteobacteria bacterium]